MRRQLYENRKSFDAARKLRETFVDRDMQKVQELGWKWPRRMIEVGVCVSVMYRSDKWQKIGNFIDYKHVSEGPQRLFVKPGGIVDYHSGKAMDLYEEDVTLPRRMPDAVAELAKILAIQVQLYDDDGKPSEEYFQINIPRATLGAAEYPGSGERFLLIYTPSELWGIVTGEELDVERDGITG